MNDWLAELVSTTSKGGDFFRLFALKLSRSHFHKESVLNLRAEMFSGVLSEREREREMSVCVRGRTHTQEE